MFINRETDYAIRIVRNLDQNNLSQIENIANKEDISINMAHKICRILKQKNFINSKSGINGGYYLNKPLDELTLFDIYGAMNDVVDINQCLMDKDSCPFSSLGICKVHDELNRIQDVILEELQKKTLNELI